MRTPRPRIVLLAAALGFAVSGCGALGAAPAGTLAPVPVPVEVGRFADVLADLAERLKPGLVHVSTRRPRPAEPAPADPEQPMRGQGSGFVIDPAGVVLTNAHVVEGADSVRVKLHDGRRFTARVVGRDTRTDLAVLRLEGEAPGLVALPLGDSNRVRVGEFVLALGHPFGLEHSVSLGIVSRKGRPLTVAAPGFDFVQTDAAVNPGNSGGPLVNMAGEVIGVTSMAAVNGSIGFAIPSSLVTSLLPRLIEKGRVDWGWLGVGIDEVDDDEAARLKLGAPRGVLVRSVGADQPAGRAGLKADDVIVAVDGHAVNQPPDLQRVIATTPPGTKVRLALVRAGQPLEVEAEIGRAPEPAARQPGPPRRRPPGAPPAPGQPPPR